MVSRCQMDSFADILFQSKKQIQFYCSLSDHNDKIQPKHGLQDPNLKHAGKDCFNLQVKTLTLLILSQLIC